MSTERLDIALERIAAEREQRTGRLDLGNLASTAPHISSFMERLSAGRCVVVVLSDVYLCSEDCMTELYKLWVNARQRDTRVPGPHRAAGIIGGTSNPSMAASATPPTGNSATPS